MMKIKFVDLSSVKWMLFIVFCVWSSSFETMVASDNSATFNVLDYGAKGDGKADDTKAFEDTWAEACKVDASIFVVPSDYVFMVNPITFKGHNCESNIVFQLDGNIKAPTSPSAWGSGTSQWLEFQNLNKFTFKGEGVIDGQGSAWWNGDSGLPSAKPTALSMYQSDAVTVAGITIQNSQQTHLKFDSCTNIEVHDMNISSPSDSPNTNGIHLKSSQDVHIFNTTLACGDDCVSIQTGCSNIHIQNVDCGPGHGFNIRSLAEDNNKVCISNVMVQDVKIENTLIGVGIQGQGGSGSVHDISFLNIHVSDVETPILIDQNYCDECKCQKESSSTVVVANIAYGNITGTYTKEPVWLACSSSTPCTDLSLENIQLQKSRKAKSKSNGPLCQNAYGTLYKFDSIPIDCLQPGIPTSSRIDFTEDLCEIYY